MTAIALLYHDVVDDGEFDASGFPGRAAGTYKLSATAFAEHIRAIAHAGRHQPARAWQLTDGATDDPLLLLTFDDGGVSAHTRIADMLDEAGWPGHFLVTTDYIGSPAFLTRDQIRDLRRRGHVIGSHSASHPIRMSACSYEVLLREWRRSTDVLAEILGEGVTVASVPGGYFSRDVAKAASVAGIRVLFTSEPTTRCSFVDECLVVGRYSLRTGAPAATAARIARGALPPRLSRWVSWNARKVVKSVAGGLYLRVWNRAFK